MIYGTRVRAAREFLQMQQAELARKLDLTPGRLAQIERSESVEIDDDRLRTLAMHLRVPPAFFSTPPFDGLGEGSMRYRAQAKVTKRVRSAVRREADLGLEVFDHLLARVSFAPPSLPSLDARTPIEEAAQQVRAALGIAPDVVVPRVINTIERSGVVVLSVTKYEDRTLDAFSSWWGPESDHPVIAISDHLPWDRYRLTALHELAHLVLHRGPGMVGRDGKRIEADANAFASAFLLPADQAREELPQPLTLGGLLPLKQRWGMSVQALLMRAKALQLIDERQSTSLWKQLSARRWRTEEPLADAREREQPRALRKMVELAYGDPPDLDALASALGRFRVDLQNDLDRYATAPSRTRTSGSRQAGARSATVLPFNVRQPRR